MPVGATSKYLWFKNTLLPFAHSFHLDSRPSFSIPFHPGLQNPSARLFQVREELTIESAGQTRAAADPSKTSASPQISAFASSSTG